MKFKFFIVMLIALLIAGRILYLFQLKNSGNKLSLGLNDFLDLTSEVTRTTINQIARDLKRDYLCELIIVVMENKTEARVRELAQKMFRNWNSGSDIPYNEFFLLLEARTGKIEFICGDGLQYILPAAESRKLIDEILIPTMNSAGLDTALMKMSAALFEFFTESDLNLKSEEWKGRVSMVRTPTKLKHFFNFLIILFSLCCGYILIEISVGEKCPLCNNRLKTRVETVRKATKLRAGLNQKISVCAHCKFFEVKKYLLRPTRSRRKLYFNNRRLSVDWKKTERG